MTELDALGAFAVALVVSAVATPLAARLAFRVGAVDRPRERGLSTRETPRLGGLAIFAAVLAAAALGLVADGRMQAVLAGAAVIVVVGALDDARPDGLPPGIKLVGQVGAGLIPVLAGVVVHTVRIPFLDLVDFGDASAPLTLLGLVAVMNVVNFSDGVDGLAAGVCAISAAAFSVIAFDLADKAGPITALAHQRAAVLAALTAGAALGFLIHNFHPASVFMGDSGSNLLGLLLGCVAIEGAVKTQAVVALLFPLVILAVPFLDTGFVVAKRIKYGRPVYSADRNHFHHRLVNIGFSQRRTVLYLYGWTLALAGFALAIRFFPWSDHHGNFSPPWMVALALLGLAELALSVYLVVVLEILKFRRVRFRQLRRELPTETSEHEIAARVAAELETGEWDAVEARRSPSEAPAESVQPPAVVGSVRAGGPPRADSRSDATRRGGART